MDETGARIEACEIVKSFEVFANEQAAQQKALHDQMMTCVKSMFSNADNTGGTRKKINSNRVSLGTVNSLNLYLSAHQRLVTSLICDIAEGRIGKNCRKKPKMKMSKKILEDVKLNSIQKTPAAEVKMGNLSKRLAVSKNKGPQNYFYSPQDLLNSLEQNKL